MKIATIIGTRPQFIKAAALSREFTKTPHIKETIIHTGQHFDEAMSDIFFRELCIPPPSMNLNIHSLPHGAMTGRMMEGIESILMKEKPDYVMVYGDSNTTLAGALAARKQGIQVLHVEAGLRSKNMEMPEEINRIITDRLSHILYCPTESAVQNLKKEGFNDFNCEIVLSGDVMEDAVLFYGNRTNETEEKPLEGKKYILCSFHRAENTTKEGLEKIVEALNLLSKQYELLLPLHPRTRQALEYLHLEINANIIPPQTYIAMMNLIQHADIVLTDSGGLQKEAFYLGKYCIILREETEWQELVKHGYASLVGQDKIKLLEAVQYFLGKNFIPGREFFGKRNASQTIVNHLLSKMDMNGKSATN